MWIIIRRKIKIKRCNSREKDFRKEKNWKKDRIRIKGNKIRYQRNGKRIKTSKKNPEKFGDVDTKSKILKLLIKKYEILKSRYEDSEYSEDEYSQNENEIKTLEQFLNTKQSSNNADRELYEEEEKKIGEWKNRIKDQDEQLDEIHRGVGQLKHEANMAGKGIKDIGIKVNNLNTHVDKTQKSVNTQNTRLKELIAKFRDSNKYCCDIILILILIGLVCTLYSVIKHKY